MDIRLRPALPADARAIAEISVRAWRAAYRGVMSDETLDGLSVEERQAGFGGFIAQAVGRSAVSVAEDGAGLVVGFVSLGPGRDEEHGLPDAGEVYAIYVDPHRWGGGAGRTLLAAAEDELRNAGFRRAFLWVLQDNPRARRFYEAAGWTWDGSTSDHQVQCERLPIVRYIVDL